MNRGLVAATAVGIVLLVGLTVAARRSHNPAHPAGGHPVRSARAARTSADMNAAEAVRMLPYPPDQIAQAARRATEFVTAYSTHRYDERPQRYVARLASIMSPQLRPAIEREAGDPATIDQRRRTQETSTARAHVQTIRLLGPSSITFVVTAIEHVTTAYATRDDTSRYAVTLIRPRDEWLVYAIELAAVGDPGDTASGGDTS